MFKYKVQLVNRFCLFDVCNREGVVALHLPIWTFKNMLWVGASSEMWTHYLPAYGLMKWLYTMFCEPVVGL